MACVCSCVSVLVSFVRVVFSCWMVCCCSWLLCSSSVFVMMISNVSLVVSISVMLRRCFKGLSIVDLGSSTVTNQLLDSG